MSGMTLAELLAAAPDDFTLRVLSRVAVDGNGCWIYQGGRGRRDYGLATRPRAVGGNTRVVHRLVYELAVGPIAPGLQLDHLCRVAPCCNPAHLEPVTCRENLMRGDTICAENVAKTSCPRGHPYLPANLRASKEGFRQCLTCHRDRERARREGRSFVSIRGETHYGA